MNPYLESAILTIQLAIVAFIPKSISIYIKTLVFFLIILGNHFMFSKAYSAELTYRFERSSSIDIECFRKSFDKNAVLTPDQRNHYTALRDDHLKEARYSFKAAKDKFWYLPDYDDRDLARYCYNAGIAAMCAGDPMSRLCAVLLTTFGKYGLDCIDEWNYIEYQLNLSKYHYEMFEFYDGVLKNG